MLTPGSQHNDGMEVTARLHASSVHLSASTAQTDETPSARTEHTEYLEFDIDVFEQEQKAQPEVEMASDDPATQALELAATRAEVKRLTRAEEELQRAVRLRDGWLQNAREEMAAAESERRSLEQQLEAAQRQINELQDLVSTLRLDLEALRATEPSSGEYEAQAAFDPAHPPRLEPVDHPGPAITLESKVITVGRTSESDLCVPSPLVSRDHARILVSSNTVTIVDVGSVNGCFVNHRQVKKQVLREGDVLRFADRAYRLMLA